MTSPAPDPLCSLKSLHGHLQGHINKFTQLNQQYKHKQEGQFLSTFMFVMDQMSNQLEAANAAYDNVDQQIEKDKLCQVFYREAEFFRNEANHLKEQLARVQQEIAAEKKRQKELSDSKTIIEQELFKRSRQIFKYSSKLQEINASPERDNRYRIKFQTLQGASNKISNEGNMKSLSHTKPTIQSFSSKIQGQTTQEKQKFSFSNPKTNENKISVLKMIKGSKLGIKRQRLDKDSVKINPKTESNFQI